MEYGLHIYENIELEEKLLEKKTFFDFYDLQFTQSIFSHFLLATLSSPDFINVCVP